ncbi:MAG: ComEC/Rec2 family competence protein, partial [Cyanobacteria bacterium P01_H01_bin.58]
MAISIAVAACLAYIAGLLCTRLEVGGQLQIWQTSLPTASLGIAIFLIGYAGFAPKAWKLGWRSQQWLGLAGIFLLATIHMGWRSPAPSSQDISRYVERVQAIAPTHIITGRVIDEPRLNRGLKSQFRIAVTRLEVEDDEGKPTFQIPVRGRLYVTAPLLQATGLHAGQPITAQGRLYLPQAALNPNGFDFQSYLTSRGTFAGLVADELIFAEQTGWGLWRVRQRLVKAQVRALGSPLGQLVSAMALGRKAVDLPFDIQDLFSRVGLAHTVAASGFHVSLLLGAVLALLRSRSGKVQLTVGLVVLTGYVILTGAQASVLRAAFMGSAALLGIALERQVKPLGALLTAVTLMLLMNPNWIWDIGFQLSVVATLGLIVMVPTLTQRLDWLPITLASLFAVPIAATLWTLPLLLYHFNVVSSISVALNVVATPLVTVISLGGIGSSAVALISPTVGSLLAHLLYYPVQLLFWLANAASQLPGSSVAIGQIARWQLVGLYLILVVGMMNLRQQFWQRSLPAVFLGLLLIPLGWQWWVQNQITVLAAGNDLIWVRQAHGHTTLINSGTEKTAFYTVQ